VGSNLSLPTATNETRAFPGSKGIQADELVGFSDTGGSTMGRAIVEEIATLASLALFVGMVAIWAQVIATL
jgi:hypothetical protein